MPEVADDFSTAETSGVDISQLISSPTTPAAVSGPAPKVSPSRPALVPSSVPPISGNAVDVSSFLGQAHQAFLTGQQQALSGVPAGVGTILPGADLATSGEQLRLQGQQQINTLDQAYAARVKAADTAMAQRLGLIPGAGNMNIAAISDLIKNSEAGVIQHQAQIEKMMNVGFLDNPMQWLQNQFSIPNEIRKLSVEEEGVKQKFGVLGELQKIMDDQHKVNLMVDQNVGTARAAALNLIAAGNARVQLASSMFEAAKTGATLANVRLVANSQQFTQAFQLNEAQHQSTAESIKFRELSLQEENAQRQTESHVLQMRLQEMEMGHIKFSEAQETERMGLERQKFTAEMEKLGMEKEAAARAAETHVLQIQQMRAVLTNEQLQQQARSEIAKQLDNVSVAFNFNKLTPERYQQIGDGPFKRFLTEQMLNPNIQSGEGVIYGRDPAQALALVNSQNFPLTPGSEYTRVKLSTMMDDVIQNFRGTTGFGEAGFKALGKDGQMEVMRNGLKERINAAKNTIPDEGGLFSPAPLLSTLKIPLIGGTTPAEGSGIPGTVIGRSLAAAANNDERYPTKAQDFFATAALLIKEGKISTGQAVQEITDSYKAILLDSNQRNLYQRFGFDGLNSKTGFRQNVITGGAFSSSKVIDMTNKAAVESALTRMMYIQGRQAEPSAPPVFGGQ